MMPPLSSARLSRVDDDCALLLLAMLDDAEGRCVSGNVR